MNRKLCFFFFRYWETNSHMRLNCTCVRLKSFMAIYSLTITMHPFPVPFISPWRWRRQDPPKRQYTTATLNGATTQKITTWSGSTLTDCTITMKLSNSSQRTLRKPPHNADCASFVKIVHSTVVLTSSFLLICISSLPLVSIASRPTLGPIQPPIRWAQGNLTPEVKRPGHEADCSLHLIPELRMRGAIPSLPHTSSWSSVWLITVTILTLHSPMLRSKCLDSINVANPFLCVFSHYFP
jgi:hypothetical protein